MSAIKVSPMNADIEEFTNDNIAVPTTAVQNSVLNDALNLNTTSSDHEGSQAKEMKGARRSVEMADIASSLRSNSSLRENN